MGDESAIAERKLLVVDDDPPFRARLGRAMEGYGFQVQLAEGIEDALRLAHLHKPGYAVVDMRLEDGNGLDLVPQLRDVRPDMRVVILTGYGNIASAVSAVKTGVVDYLAKPADAEAVANALLAHEDSAPPPPPENPMSADRVRWEHIQRVYELCGRNVSETARRLNMHRRTLQRILAKRAPR
ncbi:two-component system response regulator [Iodidimonas gelatinilytica]|uniref:Two-component system response regulator n=1 Tax=Iodidimonas gelatinilytica TaxID=1236966 RepID=A0A5A7MVJ2_9PROT|nr:ActR/PrrA/RegA family redox response regulator transcription factor [Iodidimonas gelatinilytica]GEQ99048.1 two-component system response regulator [Iodidimonas gelatinilytica]GER00766.1 two-component system response regulator [Iodidimonas gelatinilytica]